MRSGIVGSRPLKSRIGEDDDEDDDVWEDAGIIETVSNSLDIH